MRKFVKELGSHSLTYMIGNIAISGSSIVLLPLYTRYLAKSDYGILEIMDSLSSLLMILFMAGLGVSYGKFHNEDVSEKARKDVFGTIFWLVLGVSTMFISALLCFRPELSQALLGSRQHAKLMGLGLITMWVNPVYILGTMYLNMHKRPLLFLVFSLSKLAINTLVNLIFIVHFSSGAAGMILGDLISSVTTGSVLYWLIVSRNGLPFNRRLVKRVLIFGSPFIPAMTFAAVMHRGDRYLLQKFTTLEMVGLYGIGYKFPFMLGSLLLQSFGRIWGSSTQYEIAKDPNWQNIYARITTYFFMVMVVAEITVAICSTTILKILTVPAYYAAAPIIQIIAIGVCIYSLHNFFSVAALIKNKAWYLPIAYGVAGCITLGLDYLLLPRFGYIAAAWVTLLSYSVFSFTIYFMLNRFYPVPYEWGRMSALFGIGVALVLANNYLIIPNGAGEMIKEGWLICVLPAFILLGPFLKPEEAREVRRYLDRYVPFLSGPYLRLRPSAAVVQAEPETPGP